MNYLHWVSLNINPTIQHVILVESAEVEREFPFEPEPYIYCFLETRNETELHADIIKTYVRINMLMSLRLIQMII